ncbi:ABC transporter substrate-binding protein [Kocuria sp. p3-SID1433]|uniref:ABC transporter substrate-binding protein n=1 Tax=unclassified Kocuria TaxID=2649579 RepID=UPI0021A284C0|nr:MULTISPECIES: ABC transporter substrate-binding protein [unclassified Kocuria]MCT1602975.1 ABC transporter substrate-binding protein [Kocuria sp. p3-SID1428]MCT2181080.1 ABC transporter substrate-binding protein [Kocuria sp. p3-SID1433]
MHSSSRSRARVLSAAVALPILGLLLSSCAQDQDAESAGGGGHYPVTVSSCGEDVVFEQEPQRLVLLKSASVPALHELGVLDRVEAKAGAYPLESYDETTREEVEAIPSLGGDVDSSGHLSVSQEAVMAQEPDVVMGQAENLDASALSSVGIPMLEEPALCPGGIEDPGFDDVYDQLRLYGKVFDREDEAEESIGGLEDRVAAVQEQVDGSASDQEEPLTAAVLYPTVGGGTTYAYGAHSMAAPQLEAAGLENVFADLDERVAEVTPEELAGRDPDVLIVLYSEGDPQTVEDSISDIPGTDGISAVVEDRILAMPMNMTEPATPQAVDGLERIVEEFQQ